MPYTTLPLNPKLDRQQVLRLWHNNLPEGTADRYAWLYENGPATGWMLQADGQQIVGSTGLMNRAMKVFDQTAAAGQAIDLNVDREHRSVGPALGLQRQVMEAVSSGRMQLVYAFPNQLSEPLFKHLRYKLLGYVGRWVKVLSAEGALRRRVSSGAIRRAASLVADPLLRLASRETYFRQPPEVEVEEIKGFDERFDALWQTAAADFPVVGHRSADYLDWRFGRGPAAGHRILGLTDHQERLLAYLVYRRQAETVYLSDFFFAGARHFEILLAEFLRRMRRKGVQLVVTVFLGTSVVSEKLLRFGFWSRPSDWKTWVAFNPAQIEGRDSDLLNPENWYLTRADIDTDF